MNKVTIKKILMPVAAISIAAITTMTPVSAVTQSYSNSNGYTYAEADSDGGYASAGGTNAGVSVYVSYSTGSSNPSDSTPYGHVAVSAGGGTVESVSASAWANGVTTASVFWRR